MLAKVKNSVAIFKTHLKWNSLKILCKYKKFLVLKKKFSSNYKKLFL